MHVEVLIYAYLSICLAMILFNCVCIFVFRRQDRTLDRRSTDLINRITEQIIRIQDGHRVSEEHILFLRKKLRRTGNLMAFDETVGKLIGERPEETWRYIEEIRSVFTWLAAENHYRTPMEMAYFAYVISKCRILAGNPSALIVEIMMKLLEEPSLYCRENALQVIYSTGNSECVLQALRLVEQNGYFYHEKLLTDGLLNFSGQHSQLIGVLWQQFDTFSVRMQKAILDYIRFCGGGMQEELLSLLADEGRDDELRFSCIRYFGKYPDYRAYPVLLSFMERQEERRWEYASISATALASYPEERTVLVLKRAMSSANWYIRFNAAKSLEMLQLTYQELADVMDCGDRYAREILQYRLDIRQARKQEAKLI